MLNGNKGLHGKSVEKTHTSYCISLIESKVPNSYRNYTGNLGSEYYVGNYSSNPYLIPVPTSLSMFFSIDSPLRPSYIPV